MKAIEVIEHTRDGKALSPEQIRWWIDRFACGAIPDYQMAAWLMAVVWRGLTQPEVATLTEAMMASGTCVDLGPLAPRAVDKHSTGGVGDKTTLVVAPLAAAAGACVVKLSGRGLGHTGGTIDKLESISGFRTELSEAQLLACAQECGVAVAAQSAQLAPADKRMYALRDVTGTVASTALIAASVMSKKLAAGAHNIVLDVKYGRGAFVRTKVEAQTLADSMVDIGERLGRRVRAFVNPMDHPLGYAVGNALEVREAVATLRGGGPPDLRELCVMLASAMVELSCGLAQAQARDRVLHALATGAGLSALRRWVTAQGGAWDEAADQPLLPVAAYQADCVATSAGYVADIDALALGRLVHSMGGGRTELGDRVDPSVGVVLRVQVGSRAESGQVLATVHAADPATAATALEQARRAITLSEGAPVDPDGQRT